MELTSKALRTLPFFAATLALVGCGGGGASSSAAPAGRGAVQMSVEWPARTRAASSVESVSVSVNVGGVEAGRTVLNRPAGEAAISTNYTFTDLPGGNITTSVTSYPQADAAGDVIAATQTVASVKAGKTLLESATFQADEAGLQVAATGTAPTGSLNVGVH